MAEYIDREAVKEIMQKYRCSDCTNEKSLDCPLCQLHRPFDEISKIPTADVVEVVRCKNCQYFYQDGNIKVCKHWNCHSTIDDAYCSLIFQRKGNGNMSDSKNKVITESIGLLKEIISEMDCRDKVRKYLDSLEIPDRFFACVFGELVKIFGTALFEPNPYYCYDVEEQEKFIEGGSANNKLPYPKDYSYRDQIDTELTYEGGTGGWYNAFKTTCWILDMEWLLKAYEQLSWMNSDYFDEWVGDKIIEYLFEKDNYRERDYETFLKRKGVI